MHFIFYFESAKCAEQNRGYFFFSTFRDATQDSAQEFHNGFRPALTIKKKNFSLQKNQISLNAISASPKFSRKILSMKREYFTVWISELGGIEQNRKHHLTVNISPWTHAGARAKSTNPFLAGNQINVIFVERAFYRLNQRNALNRSDDLIFLSIFRDATQDGKNLTMDSHRRIQKTNKTFPCRKIK